MARVSRLRFLLAAFGAVIVMLMLLLAFSGTPDDSVDVCSVDTRTVYDVVLDAGSTGSRVHIFRFERRDDELVLEKEFFHRTQPGLSSFAEDPAGAVASVKQLMDVAMTHVPLQYQRCTSVTLKATAGLRLLPAAQSQAILHDVRRFIETQTPFMSRGVSVISGNEEGVYGWLTVNYLLGRLFSSSEPSVATMDMGGASTQLVFETKEEDGEWVPFNYVSRLRVNDRRITLYHHSYLGFGLNEARRRVYNAAASSKTSAGGPGFPCFPSDFSVEAADKAMVKGASAAGAQNFEDCHRAVLAALLPSAAAQSTAGGASQKSPVCEFRRCGIAGVPQPKLIPDDHEIFAFSYFFDRLEPFLPQGKGPVRVETLKTVGSQICDTPNHPMNKETMCLDFAYLYMYLHDGLGLPDSTPLSVREDINGKSLSWSLGASLQHLLQADA